MAKGIYIGITETHKIVEFTSNPAPTSWTNSSDNKSAIASNTYGAWAITCEDASNAVSKGFDNDDSGYVQAQGGSIYSYPKYVLTLPEGTSINPTSIFIKYGYFGSTKKIQGYNVETNAWEDIAELSTTSTSTTSQTLSIAIDAYYSAFRAYAQVYSSSVKATRLYGFRINAGTMKIPNVKTNIAHKVKKAYIGVTSDVIVEKENLVEFTSNIIPTDWLDSNSTSAICTNDYGKWSVTATGTKSGYWASDAFDGNGDSYWQSNDLEVSSSSFAVLTIQCPTGIQIQPTSIYIKSKYCGLSGNPNNVVQGYNVATQAWESIRSFYSDYNVTETTLPVSNGQWYSAFRVQVQAYSTVNYNPFVYEFQIRSGTLKTIAQSIVQKGIARKVKKGYIGVGGVARLFYDTATYIEFTSCPYLTVESDWEVVTANTDYTYTNTYGTWRVSADNSYNIAYTACRAVDNDSDTSWRSKNNYDWLYLTFPDGVTINPKTIYIKGTDNSSKRNFSIVGVKPDGITEVIAQNDGTQSFIHNFTINTDSYFTKLQLRSGNNALFIGSFHITAGTMKIEE